MDTPVAVADDPDHAAVIVQLLRRRPGTVRAVVRRLALTAEQLAELYTGFGYRAGQAGEPFDDSEVPAAYRGGYHSAYWAGVVAGGGRP